MTRLWQRLLRDLALIPLTAFIVFHLVAAVPRRVDADNKQDLARAEAARDAGALAFVEPWRKLARGEAIGDLPRYRADELWRALAGSLRVGAMALFLALVVGAALGGVRALARGAAARVFELAEPLTYGTPVFLLALMAAMTWGIPIGPREYGEYEWLMAMVMAVWPAMFFGSLLARAAAEELVKPYVRVARARGRSRLGALFVHVMPNAARALVDAVPPVATALLAGSFVVEKLFNIKYFGKIYVEAALAGQRDLVTVATTIFMTILVVVAMIVDLVRVAMDPRRRQPGGAGAPS
jgi:oligopeptide transport system permease protein